MAYSDSFPAIRPSFQFNADAGRLDPRISYTRSTTGTYFGTAKHLSSENLIPNSNTNAAWQTFDVTKSVSGSFLDGSDSLLVSETANTAIHYISPNVGAGNSTSFVSGTEYTAVMYAKAGTDNIIQVGMTSGQFGVNAYANYDLSNAATPPVTGSAASATITALGSDWVKLTLTATATSSGTGTGMFVAFTDNDINAGRAPGYAGDTASNVYLWEGNVSSTGQKHLVETNGQIHRAYAPTLQTAAINAPRLEYSPTDSASMGLLVEGSSTQLLTYSSDMSNVAWAKNNVTASVEAIGPDGSLSAVAVREGTATGHHHIRQSVTLNGNAATFSVYAKILGNARRLVIREDAASGSCAVFDLTTGTVASEVAGGTGTITSVGNGWYRCTMLCAPPAGSRLCSFWVVSNTATNYETITGDGYSGLLLAMPQAEQQSFSSSWISTTTATATRAADSASAVLSDIGYTGGPLTLVADSTTETDTLNPVTFHVYKNGDHQISLNAKSDNNRAAYIEADNSYSILTSPAAGNGVRALRVDTNDIATALNGTIDGTDTSQTLPDLTGGTVYFGDDSNGGNSIDGHIKRIAIYGEALSDTNLQALTS